MTGIESIAVAVLLALQASQPSDAAEMKALRENNIFSPKKAKRELSIKDREPRGREPERSSPPARPKPPVVTGIILDTASGLHQAVVEDRNPIPSSSSSPDLRQFKEVKFLKPGDELLSYTVESVGVSAVIVRQGETTKELKVGESFPDTVAAAATSPSDSTSSSVEKTPAKPVDTPEMDEVRKRMKERTKKNRSYDTPE